MATPSTGQEILMATIEFSSKAEQAAKAAQDHPSSFGSINLRDIREQVAEILKLVGRDGMFREYTLHDMNHIDAMLALVDRLIPAPTVEVMTTADWLMIVLSCYFHDLGMLVTRHEFSERNNGTDFPGFREKLLAGPEGKDYDAGLYELSADEREEFFYQEFVRENHPRRIAEWIRGDFGRKYGIAHRAVEVITELLDGLEPVVRTDLAMVCLSHHENNLYDLDEYKIRRVYGDHDFAVANLQYVSLILRTADVLQIQKNRAPSVLYKLIDLTNPKSQDEWAKQAGVRAIQPSPVGDGAEPDTIEVHASFDNETGYFGLLAYLQQYAGKELDKCYEWGQLAERAGAKHHFPWRHIDSSQVEPLGFEGKTYSFTLDQEKILKLLTGHMLYDKADVAVREIMQNAIDAVRFRHHTNPGEPMGRVEVHWDSKARRLRIRDTGIGMTQEVIEKFLLNVGASFYQSDRVVQEYQDFSPISRFGVGILSTFMIANEVQILTVHPDDEFARRLTLPSVVKNYLVKKVPKGDTRVQEIGPHGTDVTLTVRNSAELPDVEALLRFWIVMPGCNVSCTIDGGKPTEIGFGNVSDVIKYYHARDESDVFLYRQKTEFRNKSEEGIDIAYAVTYSPYFNVWEFSPRSDPRRRRFSPSDPMFKLTPPPGLCVEGIRVRTPPAGFDSIEGWWVFANLTGRNVPRTNVARSDMEQTPEFKAALRRIYELVTTHIRDEFKRLRDSGAGVVKAAAEADILWSSGRRRVLTDDVMFMDVVDDLPIIALEDEHSCHPASRKEMNEFENLWTVDSDLVENLEEMCGHLGIDLTAEQVMTKLDAKISGPIPRPRILGRSTHALDGLEIVELRVDTEDKHGRVDIRWNKENGRWERVPDEVLSETMRSGAGSYSNIWIAKTKNIDVKISGLEIDALYWRGRCFILPSSSICELLTALGMTERFGHWLGVLLTRGQLVDQDVQLLSQELRAGKVSDDFVADLQLPFNRRIGRDWWKQFRRVDE